MHPFQTEYWKIITALKDAGDKIAAINNPEIVLLKGKIIGDLNRHISSMTINMGGEPELISTGAENLQATAGGHVHSGPKTFLGKPIEAPTERIIDGEKSIKALAASMETEASDLQVKVDELYLKFLDYSADDLLDSVPEIEIRGVAKKAGLMVSETDPEKITSEFIDTIKTSIQNKLIKETASGNAEQLQPGTTVPPTAEQKFINDVELAYAHFGELDTASALDDFDEMVIRGVAKKAGLPVTDKSPEKVDKKFIDHIKKAIAEKEKADKKK